MNSKDLGIDALMPITNRPVIVFAAGEEIDLMIERLALALADARGRGQ